MSKVLVINKKCYKSDGVDEILFPITLDTSIIHRPADVPVISPPMLKIADGEYGVNQTVRSAMVLEDFTQNDCRNALVKVKDNVTNEIFYVQSPLSAEGDGFDEGMNLFILRNNKTKIGCVISAEC